MKKLITLLLTVLLLCSAVPLAYAEEAAEQPAPAVTDSGEAGIMPLAEETKWYYTTINGIYYKRLWSITYGKWLTEWMPC